MSRGKQLPANSGSHIFSGGEHCAHPRITDTSIVQFIVAIMNHTLFFAHPSKMRRSVMAKAVLLHAAASMVSVAVTSSSKPIKGLFCPGTSTRCLPNPRGSSMVWMMLETKRSIWRVPSARLEMRIAELLPPYFLKTE